MAEPTTVNLWTSSDHVSEYLRRADSIPHRAEGEATLLEFVPSGIRRVLDLGSGSGRLLDLVRREHPAVEAVALDFSPAMLAALAERFGGDSAVTVVEHNMDFPLPQIGRFDAVVSSFAIHHLSHARKKTLYREVFHRLNPGGVFCNLEHVSSPTPELHRQFRAALGDGSEDPSNRLLDMETQLEWLREIGFSDVDCHWKWRELALLGGVSPARP
jgi:SAM-dependent methyltransferase